MQILFHSRPLMDLCPVLVRKSGSFGQHRISLDDTPGLDCPLQLLDFLKLTSS